MRKTSMPVQRITRIGMLAAVSAVLFVLEIPIVAFYKLDVSNLPVLLGAFSMGPVSGLMILLIKDIIGLLHSSSSGVGELADFITAAAMMLPAVLIYRRQRSRKGALVGLLVGTVAMTIVGVLVNMYIMIPFYQGVMGLQVEAIIGIGAKVIPAIDSLWKFVLLITAPFNLLKGVVLSILTFLIYKPLSSFLKVKA